MFPIAKPSGNIFLLLYLLTNQQNNLRASKSYEDGLLLSVIFH